LCMCVFSLCFVFGLCVRFVWAVSVCVFCACLCVLYAQNPFHFVPVGNSLNFEFRFLAEKINKYFDVDLDVGYFHSRPYIDLKPLMVLLNGGRFKGYHLILNKPNNGSNVPIWYENKEYDKILDYIGAEATAFTSFYENVQNLMFNDNLKKIIFNTKRRMDDFV